VYAKATIKEHPIHPMIVAFPIAFYTTGLVALIVFAATHDDFWFRAAMILWFAGVAGATIAAVFGAIDLLFALPTDSAARSTGVKHGGLNLLAAILFAGAAFMMYGDWTARPPEPPTLRIAPAMTLGVIGLVLTAFAGALGWKMVQTQHVGIDDSQPEPGEAVSSRAGV
jgi:uncharacterized membrane protein